MALFPRPPKGGTTVQTVGAFSDLQTGAILCARSHCPVSLVIRNRERRLLRGFPLQKEYPERQVRKKLYEDLESPYRKREERHVKGT